MKALLWLCVAATAVTLLSGCEGGDSAKPEVTKSFPQDKNVNDEPVVDNKIVIYQMMTRLFGNTVTNNIKWGSSAQNGVGKFNDINEKALSELKKLGITHVWYTGVIEHAFCQDYTEFGIPLDDADVVKGRAGSPYAIKDYYDVNPDLAEDVEARLEEFQALIERTHEAGMKVIIDFVPNHVARSYKSDKKPEEVEDLGEKDDKTKSFSPNNNFYYIVGKPFVCPSGNLTPGPDNKNPTKDNKFDENPAKATGNDVFDPNPNVSTWFETVKLNYGVDIQGGRKTYFDPIPSTWKKMVDILKYWAEMGVDGFRCDMAEMVPVEFWGWAIPQVKEAKPDIIFVAEIYNSGAYKKYIETGKFDFLYDKVGLYDTLKPLMKGRGGDALKIGDSWRFLKGITSYMLRFLENHDEERIACKNWAKNPLPGIPGMVISATLGSGPVMIYFGQEVGETGAGAEGFGGEDGRTSIFDYWGVPAHQKWVNNKKYDGGQLNDEQKKLRSDYVRLLNLVQKNNAIRTGQIYDLTFANIKGQSEGWEDKNLYAFLRYNKNKEAVLVVANFNPTNTVNTYLKIPQTAWDYMGLWSGASLTLTEIFPEKSKIDFKATNTLNREDEKAGIPLSLKPMTAVIYEMGPFK